MELIWKELIAGFPDSQHFSQAVIRMVAAVLLGSMIGYEREVAGKSAGLRTHILVTLGTCVFVLAGSAQGMSGDGLSRVVQGIITGIGFLGAGSILKIADEHRIRGLTSAAGIWMTAAIGVTVGLGLIGLAILAAILSLIVLTVLRRFEHKENGIISDEERVAGNSR